MGTADTIYALSSGAPPAAIAVIRISGPAAGDSLQQVAGSLPAPHQASLRNLRAADGSLLDRALVLWFPGPASSTGEDCAELHCHGGRAIVAAVLGRLSELPFLREAEPGEFTRRAFENGKLDLAQAEALGDLLLAETELQRRAAQHRFAGSASGQVEHWRETVLELSAAVEAALDFSDEEDAETLPQAFFDKRERLSAEIREVLELPPVERLRDGIRVVFAGPPNAGKSSLFNVFVRDSASIVSSVPGTTRDLVERAVNLGGIPLMLVDTAGIREDDADQIERIGIERAHGAVSNADIVLWMGEPQSAPVGAICVRSRADLEEASTATQFHYHVSSVSKRGVSDLEAAVIGRAKSLLPKPNGIMVNFRQREALITALDGLTIEHEDLLIVADGLGVSRNAFDRFLGRSGIEDMLDTLFSRFCIGK